MADDPATPNPNQELLDALAQRDAQLAAAGERLARMEQTLNALNQPRGPDPNIGVPQPGKRYAIPPAIRNQIAALGLNDQEIDKNGDLIVPFIHAYLGQTAQELLTIVRNQADDISQLRMLRDVEQYPHADALFNEVTKVRQAEAQAGRYMPIDVAYRVAVANNYDKIAGAGTETAGGAPGGQFDRGAPPPSPRSAAPPSPAQTRARDMSASAGLRTMRAPVVEPNRDVTRVDDLMSMSREERKAFFEQNRETPIR